MRITTPACLGKTWFACIYFQEIGRPFPIIIGGKKYNIGRGREYYGQVTMVEIEVEKNVDDIHILPPAIILSVVAATTHTPVEEARRYMSRLSVERDATELVKPSDVVVVDDLSLMRDVSKGRSDQLLQQIEVQEGKRRRFLQ